MPIIVPKLLKRGNNACVWSIGMQGLRSEREKGRALYCIALYQVHCLILYSIMSCLVLSCPILSSPLMSCPVMSCPDHFCPVLFCPVLSHPSHFFPRNTQALQYLGKKCRMYMGGKLFNKTLCCSPWRFFYPLYFVVFIYWNLRKWRIVHAVACGSSQQGNTIVCYLSKVSFDWLHFALCEKERICRM